MEKFGKAYKLCSKKVIGDLFKEGKQLRTYPFSVHYKIQSLEENIPFQVVFAAPKRNFKRAHDRNYIKRLMRETLRKEKSSLEALLKEQNHQLAFFILYNQRELPNYEVMEKGMRKFLSKLLLELKKD